MAVIGKRHIRSIETTSENEGRPVVIEEYVDLVDVGTPDDPNATIEGMKELLTADEGWRVNRLDTGRYQIVQTGEVLTSDDPDAP